MIRASLILAAIIFSFCPASGLRAEEAKVEAKKICGICWNPPYRTVSRPCIRKVCTEVICRETKTLCAKGACGEIYTYTVMEITYRDVFCDGSTRIWKSSL